MDHRLPQVLGGGLTLLTGTGPADGLPVVPHDLGVVDRHQVGLAVEVLGRVTALAEHPADQDVRLGGGQDRLVDETRLHLLPLRAQLLAASRLELVQLQLGPAVPALGQLPLGRVAVPP